MLKFIRGKSQQTTTERQRLQKELYLFRRTAQHGFPHKPTALAYDSKQRLMAIGSNSGQIKVFGQPGVEFYGQHQPVSNGISDCSIQLLEWVPGSGRILSLSSGNLLILWEPANNSIIALKSLVVEGKLKKISTMCSSMLKDVVWIGTEGGFVYQLDLRLFQLEDPILSHESIHNQLPQPFHHNPGPIECVKQLPNNLNNLLIAFNRGLCIIWDINEHKLNRSFVSPGHGQSVGLYVEPEGDKFTWYHADGSYATWYMDIVEPPEDEKYVPYGPDPCKSINRLVRGFRNDDEIIIFSGGMPRSAYGDHQCVSVHCKDGTKIALDFTSRIIDFFVVFHEEEVDQALILVVLLEEELIGYDLTDKNLPLIIQPYLHSVHASAVTCIYLASNVTDEVFGKIRSVGELHMTQYSKKEWPVTGGHIEDDLNDSTFEKNILITGHEDGSIKLWDCSQINLKPLLQVKTSLIFGMDDDGLDSQITLNEAEEEGVPPFRKAGNFDPYSDDPRLAVKKIAMCPQSGILVIGGTAGNIVIFSFEENTLKKPVGLSTINLVSDRDGFVWKGHDQLLVNPQLGQEYVEIQEGIQIISVVQISPPAALTCLALQSSWGLFAAGTAHGLILFDYQHNHPILHKCTLNPNDISGQGETLSRRKSFKKTLRESFRRLRKGRSTKNDNILVSKTTETRPMERQIEARPTDDGLGSMVRCLTFANTYVTNANVPMASLWAGTNSSCVSVFVIYIPQITNNVSSQNQITGQLAKEIQLKHRAPVIGITHYDNAYIPLEFQQNGSTAGSHKVLIASEEQFKVFSLPHLKPVTKYKLTAHEGARIRKIQFATFTSKILQTNFNLNSLISRSASPPPTRVASAVNNHEIPDANSALASKVEYMEIGLLCLTNLGDCFVLSVPELKKQITATAIRREDINGISSLCFTNKGEALYMMSSSELQRITLSVNKVITPRGLVDLDLIQYWSNEAINDNCLDNDTTKLCATELKPCSSQSFKNESDWTYNQGNDAALIGDISVMTIDSVKDHLNTTGSTICSQTTEEIVGQLSVLSNNSINQLSVANSNEIIGLNLSNMKDINMFGETIETNSTSTIIKTLITTLANDNEGNEIVSASSTNGE